MLKNSSEVTKTFFEGSNKEKGVNHHLANPLNFLVGRVGIEPTTY